MKIYDSKAGIHVAWSVALTLNFLLILCHQLSIPTSNYFAYDPYRRYFLLILLFPSVISVVIAPLAAKSVGSGKFAMGTAIVLFILLMIFGGIASGYESYNPEYALFIFGYMIIYHRYLYSALICFGRFSIYYNGTAYRKTRR